MWRRFGYLIRRDERRAVAVAFAFVFGLVASHTALESARDGLFLAKISGDRLPFLYVTIALLSYGASRSSAWIRLTSRRTELALWTAFAGVGTFAIGLALEPLEDVGLYVLYVWSGVVTATVLVHFWSILGDVFTATQAKRVFGVVGIGGMVGAVAGSGTVSLIARSVGPKAIVFGAAVGFLLVALLPRALPSREGTLKASARQPNEHDPLVDRFRANMKYATRGPYVWRLIGIALAGSTAVTLTDFVFKQAIVSYVPPADLTTAFARTYAVLNMLSLVVQLLGVSVLLRRFAPAKLISVLPLFLVFGGAATAVTGGLAGALFAKGADGALRHGLNRTSLELLTVPLSEEARRKVKTALDIVGQRGGQIVASSIILLASATAHGARSTAAVLVLVSVVWAGLALKLHGYYLAQFRDSIVAPERRVATGALDVASLETLVATLDSDSTDEVLAALSLLEREGKAHLVPGLILFHPREDVVVAALRLFVHRKRPLPAHARAHIISHPSARVRAEAYAAMVSVDADGGVSASLLETETSPEVRAALLTALIANDAIEYERGRSMLDAILLASGSAAKIIVAETIGWRRVAILDDLAAHLATDPDRDVRVAAIHALGSIATPHAGAALVDLLGDDTVQEKVRAALVYAGPVGFAALADALEDRARASAVRWAIPRALASVDPPAAARVLLENLEHESDGMVRYRTLVALGTIVERAPHVILDIGRIHAEIRENVARAYRTMDRRMILEAGAAADSSRATEGHKLLVDLLRGKEKSAVGRIYRLLGLAFPQHEFGAIYRALENGERPQRAGAVELTSNLLPSPLREAVVGLVDDLDDDARMTHAGPHYSRVAADYEGVVCRLVKSRSPVLRDVAAFHASEIGGDAAETALRDVMESGKTSGDIERALEVLAGARSVGAGRRESAMAVTHVG